MPEQSQHSAYYSEAVHCAVAATLNGRVWQSHKLGVLGVLCRIAKVVRESPQVERFLHVSALGAAMDAPSKRLRTKVRNHLPPAATALTLGHKRAAGI